MPLNVAVQMDHISTVSIAGDSTFALMLEAQRRGHTLFHYTPDRLSMRDGKVFARIEEMQGARREGQPFHARRAGPHRSVGDGRGAAAPGPALRHGLHHHHAYARAHPSRRRWWSTTRPGCATPGKDLRHRIPRPDAADADHQGSARGRGLPQGARRHHRQAALRQWRRRRLPSARGRPQPRLAARNVRPDVPRALHRAALSARTCARATSASS